MYCCIKLSKEMQERVMNVFNAFFTIPEGWTKHCDHITLIHSSNEHWITTSKIICNFKGKSLDFRIVGVGYNENVMALEVDTFTANRMSHITICTAPNHKPVEANTIEHWDRLYCKDIFSGVITFEL